MKPHIPPPETAEHGLAGAHWCLVAGVCVVLVAVCAALGTVLADSLRYLN